MINLNKGEIEMLTNIMEARQLLKEAKIDIKEKYGWNTRDYKASVHETKKGLKLIITLLVPRKGFSKIYAEITEKVKVKLIHSDTTHKKIIDTVTSVISAEFDKGVTKGFINDIEWKIGLTNEQFFPVKNATIDFVNKLYDL